MVMFDGRQVIFDSTIVSYNLSIEHTQKMTQDCWV
jgi:hypothetical protein